MRYICIKDLFMQDTVRRVFTCGNVYECNDRRLNSKSLIKDDEGDDHQLGADDDEGPSWKIYFVPENFKVKNK